jgi:sialate O-acetylesterase
MKRLITATAIIAAFAAQAKVKLAAPFTDGMVLQREMPVRVWGTADAGEKVKVIFGDSSVDAVADASGKWLVELPAMKACKTGRTLAVNDIRVSDVLVGEVWMCAGQSNTDCPVWGQSPRYRDAWGSMMLMTTDRPFVRLVKTPKAMALEPKLDVKVEWMKMTPALWNAWKSGKAMPSAMGYYYALELANALDIPIGLVDSSWGGTNVDTWTPRSGYKGLSGLDVERDWKMVPQKDWKPSMAKGPIGAAHKQTSALWYGMVAAYTPMSVRGFIWYQGCSNSGEPQRYANKMQALYNGWATEFKNPDLSLYFVQLAPWGFKGIALIQEAQAKFAAAEKNAAMAVINDVGNLHDIHPNDKRTVAKRLSLHALKRNYGWKNVQNESPTLKSWKVEGSKFILSFNDADGFYVYNADRSLTTGFEVCGADGVWKPAKISNFKASLRNGKKNYHGTVEGKDLIVEAEGVAAPKKLRYLYSAPWFGALYSEAGLPVGAFHIGD